MNKKDPKQSIFRRKGFYIALYSCLGVVMLTTAVVSLNNLAGRADLAAQTPPHIDLGQLEPVGTTDARSYLEQQALDAELSLRRNQPSPSPAPEPQEQQPEGNAAPASPEVSPSPPPDPQGQGDPQEPAQEPAQPVPNQPAPPQADYQSTDGAESPYLFEFFDNTQRMEWPVLGEVVMGFSSDRMIYDRTLDQYRTNDTISIAAEMGQQVLASASGIVEFVGFTREIGNYVIINHGNGWSTTYGQLQDGVLVRAGDVVRAGQPIGGVGNPSIYSVLLGNHVNFRIENHGSAIDPISILR